jgi:hypothetical protein
MRKHFIKTIARSPRANSTLKTSESRETYRMVEEILDILHREGTDGRYISTLAIIKMGTKLGYCRPYRDADRIAAAHPYWKILSEMTDPKSVHFINNLEEISTDNVLRYRLRTDVVRSASTGNWRRVKGATSFYGLPDNR